MDIVILAAGKGTRMRSPLPKALVPLLGVPMLHIVLNRVRELLGDASNGDITTVVGHKKEEIIKSLEDYHALTGWKINHCEQKEMLGTADALKSYFSSNKTEKSSHTMVLCCDTPLLNTSQLKKLRERAIEKKLDAVVATFETENPTGYGRIINFPEGLRIVEEKDANSEQRSIKEVNSGLYVFKTDMIESFLSEIDNKNASGEFYLTDVFKEGRLVESFNFGKTPNFNGVNDVIQLEEIENEHRLRNVRKLQEKGVRFMDSKSAYISENTEIGEGSLIYPNVYFEGNNSVEEGCTIELGTHIKNSIIQRNSTVLSYSVLEKCLVRESCQVGPFARLRPGADLGEGSKIGNFVEIKKSKLHPGVKVSHLSYVGDAEIGNETNIGCGFITCNYDGANKHKTTIGKDCFIGSDTQMVAPVTIGDGCFVASGSTINQNMPAGSFGISRSKQVIKEGAASRFIKKK